MIWPNILIVSLFCFQHINHTYVICLTCVGKTTYSNESLGSQTEHLIVSGRIIEGDKRWTTRRDELESDLGDSQWQQGRGWWKCSASGFPCDDDTQLMRMKIENQKLWRICFFMCSSCFYFRFKIREGEKVPKLGKDCLPLMGEFDSSSLAEDALVKMLFKSRFRRSDQAWCHITDFCPDRSREKKNQRWALILFSDLIMIVHLGHYRAVSIYSQRASFFVCCSLVTHISSTLHTFDL